MEPGEYDRMNAVEDEMWWYAGAHANALAGLARYCPDAGAAILDAGCGTGGLLRQLTCAWPDRPMVGLDYDGRACAMARAKSGRAAVQGSVDRLPFADRTFGAIVSLDVLCHQNVDDRAALHEMSRCLAPGGVLILNLPAYAWMMSYHDCQVRTARRYDRGELKALFAATGLETRLITYWNSFLFPLMILRRKLLPAPSASDVAPYPPWLDRLFRGLLAIERRCIAAGIGLPFGGSLLSIWVKHG
ncbi:MAG: class I SAM-dependent methyltransferase [Alphaproteobacteria bacterium]|nr:class I SAM-dependent methyltransferase [Alphaproteobacteria bacterium]